MPSRRAKLPTRGSPTEASDTPETTPVWGWLRTVLRVPVNRIHPFRSRAVRAKQGGETTPRNGVEDDAVHDAGVFTGSPSGYTFLNTKRKSAFPTPLRLSHSDAHNRAVQTSSLFLPILRSAQNSALRLIQTSSLRSSLTPLRDMQNLKSSNLAGQPAG